MLFLFLFSFVLQITLKKYIFELEVGIDKFF